MAALPRLKVSFDQPDNGWLKLELRSEQIARSETFSHLYPTLPNLCEALCDVAERREVRQVVLLLEPQELELRFVSQDNHTCLVNGLRFRDHRRDLENAEIVFVYAGPSREVVLSFWRALRQLQTSLPAHEFTARWHEPFPAREMEALTAAVATMENDQREADTQDTRGGE
jgi:hypothetical protein